MERSRTAQEKEISNPLILPSDIKERKETSFLYNNKYLTTAQIYERDLITLYLGVIAETSEQVAIKVEKAKSNNNQLLPQEARTLTSLQPKPGEASVKGVPKFIWYGNEDDLNILVYELLGPNLVILHKMCSKKFSLKTVLTLADQMLRRLEYLHSKGYVHKDISPQSFTIGLHANSSILYLNNLCFARHFKNSKTGTHKQYSENKEMVGSIIFNSINSHLGIEPSRRDDLEALGYTLIYLSKNALPWQQVIANSLREKQGKVMDKKMSTPPEVLCKGLPDAFAILLTYSRNLKFDEKPDYKYLRDLFKRTANEKGIVFDNNYDWVSLEKIPSNPIYEYGNLNISYRGISDISVLNLRSYVNQGDKSRLYHSSSEPIGFKKDEFKEFEQVPEDLSIYSASKNDKFPSKAILMPEGRKSKTLITSPFQITNTGSFERLVAQKTVLTEGNEVVDKGEDSGRLFEKSSIDKNVSRTQEFSPTKTSEATDDYKKSLSEPFNAVKTISLRVPDKKSNESWNRNTTYNVTLSEDPPSPFLSNLVKLSVEPSISKQPTNDSANPQSETKLRDPFLKFRTETLAVESDPEEEEKSPATESQADKERFTYQRNKRSSTFKDEEEEEEEDEEKKKSEKRKRRDSYYRRYIAPTKKSID